jgi:bifunctional ADP-heptose synthase (sugar kinase/adenylyltransferase)
VDTVDTTGAGDVFHAAFAYALLRGDKLPEILEFSCAAAGLNCTAPGARGGIRPVDEIEELRREGGRHKRLYADEELRRGERAAAGAARHTSSKK